MWALCRSEGTHWNHGNALNCMALRRIEGKHGNQWKTLKSGKALNPRTSIEVKEIVGVSLRETFKKNRATLDVSFASEWRKASQARKRIEVKGSVGVSLRETLKTKQGHTQGELCVGVKDKIETMQKHWVVGEHWNQGNVEVKESDEQCQSQKKASDALHGSKSVQNGTGKRKKRKASQSKSWGDRLTIPTDEGNGEVANVRG